MNIDRIYDSLFKLNEVIGMLALEEDYKSEFQAMTLIALNLHKKIASIISEIKKGEELQKLHKKMEAS